ARNRDRDPSPARLWSPHGDSAVGGPAVVQRLDGGTQGGGEVGERGLAVAAAVLGAGGGDRVGVHGRSPASCRLRAWAISCRASSLTGSLPHSPSWPSAPIDPCWTQQSGQRRRSRTPTAPVVLPVSKFTTFQSRDTSAPLSIRTFPTGMFGSS